MQKINIVKPRGVQKYIYPLNHIETLLWLVLTHYSRKVIACYCLFTAEVAAPH